jgi:hypothetical protein
VFENRVLRRIFEKMVLRRIFGPKRLIRCCRILHNEIHNLYSSPSIIRMIKSRRMRWAGHVARMGENKDALMGKTEGKGTLGRPKRRRVDNIKLDLRELGWEGTD